MSTNKVSPFVKRMRATGGTIYTFSSAVEDIGLNVNERNNVVKISHFALLNIPNVAEASTGNLYNTFNVRNIAGAWEYEQNNTTIKDGRVIIAESFQNYALNFESNLLSRNDYKADLPTTVSERVFWKWLKETGAIRWDSPFVASNGTRYWVEEADGNSYSSVVKYIGLVSAGNVRIDTFGTFNETYILVPTSHGQTSVYFKQVEDDNYKHGMQIGALGENILGRESYTRPHPDALSYLAYYDFVDSSTSVGSTPYQMYYDNSTGVYSPGWWYSAEGITPSFIENAYMTDVSSYITTGIYNTKLKYQGPNTIEFKRSKLDCMSVEFNLDNLRGIYNDSALTYDSMASAHSINDRFEFNAVLIYYSIYNSTMDAVIATNLLGVMFLDAPSGNTTDIMSGFEGIQIPSLEKVQSTATGFGTAYSLRLNIKTDNMIDDTGAVINDGATSDQLMADQWQTAIQNLASAVGILSQQAATLEYISRQYTQMRDQQTQSLNDLAQLTNVVNDISRDISGSAGTIALFSDGDDPLIDSSIYMYRGRVGFFNDEPVWPVQVDASLMASSVHIGQGNWSIEPSGTFICFKFNNQKKMVLDPSGNMYISGTVTPSANI